MEMAKKQRLALVALFAVVGGAYGFQTLSKDRASPLTLYGNVDIREVDLGFRVDGKLARLMVDEGDAVKEGDLLASLDAEPLRHARDMAAARLAREEAALARLEAGMRAEEIEQARALVAEREATLTNAQLRYDRQSRLVKDGAVSKQAFDQAAAALREARARAVAAKEALELAVEGSRIEDIDAGRAAVAMAEAERADAERRLRDANLFAPSDGVILARVREKGAILRTGETVFSLSLREPVWVRAYVSQTDLGDVFPGREVKVHTDGRPGESYLGVVGYVSPTAEFTPKTVQTEELRTSLVYRLRIVIDDPDEGLRQGMPVTVALGEGRRERDPGAPAKADQSGDSISAVVQQ